MQLIGSGSGKKLKMYLALDRTVLGNNYALYFEDRPRPHSRPQGPMWTSQPVNNIFIWKSKEVTTIKPLRIIRKMYHCTTALYSYSDQCFNNPNSTLSKGFLNKLKLTFNLARLMKQMTGFSKLMRCMRISLRGEFVFSFVVNVSLRFQTLEQQNRVQSSWR